MNYMKRMHITLTEEDAEIAKEKAKEYGVTVSALVRIAIRSLKHLKDE